MPATFNVWGPIVGTALADAANAVSSEFFPSEEEQLKRQTARTKRELLPLETAVAKQQLQAQLRQTQRGGKHITKITPDWAHGRVMVEFVDLTTGQQGYEFQALPGATAGPAAPKEMPYPDFRHQQLRQKYYAGTLTQPETDELRDYLQSLPGNQAQPVPESGQMRPRPRQTLEELMGGRGTAPPTPQQPAAVQPRAAQPPAQPLPLGTPPTAGAVPPVQPPGASRLAPQEVHAYTAHFRQLGQERATQVIEALVEMQPQGKAAQLAKEAYLSLWGNQPLPPSLQKAWGVSAPIQVTVEPQTPLAGGGPTVPGRAGGPPAPGGVPGPAAPPTPLPTGRAIPPGHGGAPQAQEPAIPRSDTGASPKYDAQALGIRHAAVGWKPEHIAAARRLAAEGKIPSADPAELTIGDMQKVDQAIAEGKQEQGYAKRVTQARMWLAEQSSMNQSRQQLKMIEPLLKEQNVGLRGMFQDFKQTFLDQVPWLSEDYKDKMFNEEIPLLENLGHSLAYIHANAVKSTAAGGGAQRGVIENDILRMEKLFDPLGARGSVRRLKAQLKGIDRFIQNQREMVDNMLTNMGIDPVTHGPLKGYTYEHDFSNVPPPDVDPMTVYDQLGK